MAESAFAVLLLVAATMLARSFIKLTQVDAGYTSNGVLAAEIYVPGGDADDRGPAMNTLVKGLVDRARDYAWHRSGRRGQHDAAGRRDPDCRVSVAMDSARRPANLDPRTPVPS